MDEKQFRDYMQSPEWKNRQIFTLPREESIEVAMWEDPRMGMILMAVLMFPWFGTDEQKNAFTPFSDLGEDERNNLNERFRLFCENLPENGMSVDMIPIQLRKVFGMEEIND